MLVTTPTYKTYFEKINKKRWGDTLEKLGYFQTKYDIQYFNYLTDQRFSIKDFQDNDHLNSRGAEKFSTIINNEILKRNIR